MQTKQFNARQLKVDGEGQFSAVFATLNVVDKDGDVLRPGSVESGQPVRISAYGHRSWNGELPVGKGVIREEDDELIVDGQFFLGSQVAKDTYETVKGLGELQEWSFGFDVITSSQGEFEGTSVTFLEKMDVHEVSPVMLGAGIGTRTVDVKSLDHDELATLAKEVTEQLNAVSTGDEVEEVSEGVEEKADEPGETFADHATRVRDDVSGLIKRCHDIVELRREKGKTLGQDSSDRVRELRGDLEKAIGEIDEILGTDDDGLDELELQYYEMRARRMSHE